MPTGQEPASGVVPLIEIASSSDETIDTLVATSASGHSMLDEYLASLVVEQFVLDPDLDLQELVTSLNSCANCYSPLDYDRTNAILMYAQYDMDIELIKLVSQNADYAMLSTAAYEKNQGIPIGDWEVEDTFTLDPLGQKNFRARLFKNNNGEYVLAFAGTDFELLDLVDDAASFLNIPTPAVIEAIEVAKKVKSKYPGVKFVGHSLGGRLAQVAMNATGNSAIVFNSAFTSLSDMILTGGQSGNLISFSSPHDPVSALTPGLGGITVRNLEASRLNVFASHAMFNLTEAMLEVDSLLPSIEAYLRTPLQINLAMPIYDGFDYQSFAVTTPSIIN